MKSMSKKLFALALCLALSLSLSVAVSAAAPTGVTVQESLTLTLGTSKVLTATKAPADAEGTVTWSSSDATVAAVDSDGKVTAKKVGTATITAKLGSFTDTCEVTVNNQFAVGASVILEDYDDYLVLSSLVEELAEEWAYENQGVTETADYKGSVAGLDYGEVDDGYYWLDNADVYQSLPVTDAFTCTVRIAGVDYKVTVNLKLYGNYLADSFGVNGGNLGQIAAELNELMGVKYPGEDLEYLYLDTDELDSGMLFTSSAMNEEFFDNGDAIGKSDFADLFFLPDGSGETVYLPFEAYTDDTSADEYLNGYVVLNSDEFMLLDYTISNQETLTLSAEDFEEAYLALNDNYAYLDRVRFTSGISNGSSKGYFYIDYETEGDDATKVANSSSKYYYSEPEDKQVGIDTITYVPGANTKSLVYTITFKAHGFDEDGKEVSKTSGKTGYLRINVVEAADLQVTAGPGELTAIDPDFFQEYVAENAFSTSKKKYVVTRVAFSGVPASKDAGWLYTDGDEVTGSGTKTFYMEPKNSNQMDLNDLYFLGGNKAGVKRVNFTIYGKAPTASATARDSSVATGTMDLIVGAPRRLQYGVYASQSLSFGGSLDYLAAMGNNENTYIVFRGQPTIGGKLIYTDALGAKTPIVAGEKYYLTAAGYGQKAMAGVSFLPGYSNSKIARTVSLPVIAGNAKGKEVEATLDITIQYASSSTYFSDVQIFNNPNAQRYADSVDYLRVKGITTGNNASGTTFGWDKNITRGEFVTFLYRAANKPSVVGLTNPFTDVSKAGQPYFYEAILWASKEGITTGRGNGIFDPNANVSYQEVLTFLHRYYVNYLKNTTSGGSLYGFADAGQLAEYAKAPAAWAAGKGIVDYYYDGGLLKPTTAATRGDVALFLHRMLTL